MGKIALIWITLQAPPDHWFGADKLKHFFASGFVQSVSYSALRATHAEYRTAMIGAGATTVVIGVAKEVWDHRRGGPFSYRDLTWDVAGGAAFGSLVAQTRR